VQGGKGRHCGNACLEVVKGDYNMLCVKGWRSGKPVILQEVNRSSSEIARGFKENVRRAERVSGVAYATPRLPARLATPRELVLPNKFCSSSCSFG